MESYRKSEMGIPLSMMPTIRLHSEQMTNYGLVDVTNYEERFRNSQMQIPYAG
jgi:hypothetical protein